MTAEEAGTPSPERRSKLFSAVAQASARMSKSKASIFRSSGEPTLCYDVNENAANHEVSKPSSQDALTEKQQQNETLDMPSPPPKIASSLVKKTSPLSKIIKSEQQQHQKEEVVASKIKIKTKSSPTRPQQHFADMLLRRKDHKSRLFPPPSEPHNYAAVAAQQKSLPKPLVLRQTININKRNIMVHQKSHQRLILEQIAAKYFLNNNGTFSRYAGVTGYGEFDDNNSAENVISENGVASEGSASTPLGLADIREEGKRIRNKEKEALDEFLETFKDDIDDTAMSNIGESDSNTENDASVVNSVGVISESTRERDAILAVSPNRKKSTAQQIQDIEEETNIDSLLEIASNHLSLGRNELALQAYRRAMKRAFSDVMSVKKRLEDIKKHQAKLTLEDQELKNVDLSEYVESSELALSKKQETEFESSLLQVASRVADIHNNMGVVHEMNRNYNKAQASYRDALDVYHNTCKRFENSDDPDVVKTHQNVERMKNACESEEQRTALHEKALRIAEETKSSEPTLRKKSLTAAVAMLKQALKVEVDTVGSTHPVVATTLIQMGKYFYEMRDFDAAVSVIRKSIRILQDALGKNHPQVCKAILLLASIYERHGMNVSPKGVEKDAELELYVDVLEPLKSSLGDVHSEVALVYTKIGYLYGKKRDQSLSLLAYKAALKAYGEPSSTTLLGGVHPEVISVWVCVTEHLHSMKSWKEVLVAGHRALFFLRLARKSFFRDAELHHLSASLTSTASVNSVPLVKTNKRSPIQISSETYYDALYTTLSSLGQAHIALQHYQLARGACHEALQLSWEMALSSQHDESRSELVDPAILQLIRGLKRSGKVLLLQKHYQDALDCFLPCLELLRSSKTTESTLDTASVLGSLGFLYLKLKRFTESSNFLRECLRLYRKNGVDVNDRETRKVNAWLEMAESREEGFEEPPTFLEIPTIVI